MTPGMEALRLDFTVMGEGARWCGLGWSVPEADGTWTEGGASELVLPAPRLPVDHVLLLRLRPLLAPALPAQRLALAANGVPLARFTLTRPGLRACILPRAVLARAPRLTLGLALPDAARPAELGLNDDRRRLGVSLSRLDLYPDLAALAPAPAPPANAAALAALPPAALLGRFESLGENCEFGLVQRRCGAEPLGLLRFASTPLPRLLEALAADFAGLGAPAAIDVRLSANGREYMVHDRAFGLLYHAWVKAGELPPEAIRAREARRLPFLVNKLREDLAAAEKLFVFKGMGAIPAEEAYPLALAIRRYGPNTLLLASLADAANPPGSVRRHAPGLLIGHLDRFAPGEDAHDLSLACWLTTCRNALHLAHTPEATHAP